MQRTHLPNGVVVWFEPGTADHLIVEYPDGERTPAGRADRRRLTRITKHLREVYESLLLHLSDERYNGAVPVDALLKLDEIVSSLGSYASQQPARRVGR